MRLPSVSSRCWAQVAAFVALIAGDMGGAALAATPPSRVNHHGVLRDVGGNPPSGQFDMTFRFFSDAAAGDEILVVAHAGATIMPASRAERRRPLTVPLPVAEAVEPGDVCTDEAPVVLAGMVALCKVDATESPIEANDLLMSSSLAGHAMRASTNPAQGTVIGKALEPMPGGTGMIRVLVLMGR